MTSFTDFTSGLQSADDYLSARHHLSGTTAIGSDALRVVTSANYSFSLKELICGLLGGHGFKLPNIQICIFANLNALLGLDQLQAVLRSALTELSEAFSSFMDMLSVDSVLGRLNSVLNEAINVANMINFCGSPIDPIAIPNLIEQAFGSLLGKGDALISKIGIPPIDTCLSFDPVTGDSVFNVDGFLSDTPAPGSDSSILYDIATNYDAIYIGEYGPTSEVEALVNKINGVTNEINELVVAENDIKGAYTTGGSDFVDTPSTECSTSLGILHSPTSAGIAGNSRIASSLKGVYDRLAGYPVQYIDQDTGDVTEYPNIFHLMLTPEMLAILDQDIDDDSTVTEQIPVYDYCGNIIGYTTNVVQGNPDQTSNGTTPSSVTCPGDPTNYDPTDERSSLIYPNTSVKTQPSDTTISDSVSSSVGSVDQETGYTSTVTQDETSTTSNSSTDARKRAGDNWFYLQEIEYYEPSSAIQIDLRRRDRGNYIVKHSTTVNQNSTITFIDHDRKTLEAGYFELMVEHISNTITFGTSIIWEGGFAPTMLPGNYHVFEFRNYGGNGWTSAVNDNNVWLGKIVGSFPI